MPFARYAAQHFDELVFPFSGTRCSGWRGERPQDGRAHEVKELATGVQTAADPATWSRGQEA